MRWFFLILLLLNIALFAWFQQEQEMRSRTASRAEFSGPEVMPLKLLSEMPIRLRRRTDAPSQAASGTGGAKEGEGAIAAPECVQISGFDSLDSARRFLQQELSRVYVGKIREADFTVIEYWVYVRAPEDREERRALRKRLQAEGFEVSVAEQGVLEGQLSLGLYQRPELALALYNSLGSLKYDVDIFELPRKRQRPVVEIYARTDERPLGSEGAQLSRLMESFSAGLKSEKKVCQGVASH